jgi:hypothetical protein
MKYLVIVLLLANPVMSNAGGDPVCKVVAKKDGTFGISKYGSLLDNVGWTDGGVEQHLTELQTLEICGHDSVLNYRCRIHYKPDGSFGVLINGKLADNTEWTDHGSETRLQELKRLKICGTRNAPPVVCRVLPNIEGNFSIQVGNANPDSPGWTFGGAEDQMATLRKLGVCQ